MEYEAVKQIEKEIKSLRGCGMERLDAGTIRAGATHTDWIPVSERLPEEKQKVWVTKKMYRDIRVVEGCVYLDGEFLKDRSIWGGEFFGENGISVTDITVAWMPRFTPEPYKPEQDTQEAGTAADRGKR